MIQIGTYKISGRPVYKKDVLPAIQAIQPKMTGRFDMYICGSALNTEPVPDLDIVINSEALDLKHLYQNMKAIIETAVAHRIFIDVVYWDVSIIAHHHALTTKTVTRIHFSEYLLNGEKYFESNFEVVNLPYGLIQTSKVFPSDKQINKLKSGFQYEKPLLIYTSQ